mgnify:CR=1 FL=1
MSTNQEQRGVDRVNAGDISVNISVCLLYTSDAADE